MLDWEPAGPEHTEFLYELYAETRRGEPAWAGWREEERESFLRMQFEMRTRSYALQYPSAEQQIVTVGGAWIGTVLTADTGDGLVLIDLALLPSHRSRGLGTQIVRRWQEQAAALRKPLLLHVSADSPARRLYERLGFVPGEERALYLSMKWSP